MKQSENYKNITESTLPPLDRMDIQDTIPPSPNHNQSTNQTGLAKHFPDKELQQDQNKLRKKKSYSGTSEVQKPTLMN